MNLKNIFQYSLCTLNITAAAIYPVLNEQYSIWVRVGGIFVGLIYVFQSARRRLHTILKDAGITPRTWRKTVGE